MTRQRTGGAVPRTTPRWPGNGVARPSADKPQTLGMPQMAWTARPPGQRCRCRGAHLAQMVRRRRPPNCGASTCRRPCSAAGWNLRRTPSHSPGSPEPDPALAARPLRAAASLHRLFSRRLRLPPRRRLPLLRPAHQRSPNRRHPGRPWPRHRERRQNQCHREPVRQKRCRVRRCRRTRPHRSPRYRPRRWRRHLPCRWAARRWRPRLHRLRPRAARRCRPRRHPRCRRALRRWRPRPGWHHRPKPLRLRRTWRHRPAHAQRPLLRRPATAGPPIRAERDRVAVRGPVRGCRSPRPRRPPSGHGGPAGPTASLA